MLTASALCIVAQAQSLAWLLVAAVPIGLGAGAVDAGLNGFVARHYSGRHMNWLHACWGIGATLGPLLMTRALGLESGWRGGYISIASLQFAFAAVFLLTLRRGQTAPARIVPAGNEDRSGPLPTALAHSAAGWLSTSIFALGRRATQGGGGLREGQVAAFAARHTCEVVLDGRRHHDHAGANPCRRPNACDDTRPAGTVAPTSPTLANTVVCRRRSRPRNTSSSTQPTRLPADLPDQRHQLRQPHAALPRTGSAVVENDLRGAPGIPTITAAARPHAVPPRSPRP